MCGENLCSVLHVASGSYLLDALQEGSADVVARIPIPRA
jgi:hypothetical protein